MYTYPLRLNYDPNASNKDLTIVDAKKKEILFRPKPSKDVKNGRTPLVIFSARDRVHPIFHVTFENENDEQAAQIRTATDLKLGQVKINGKRKWHILDAQDLPFGEIIEKCPYKTSFWEILWSASVVEDLIKVFLPHRFEVYLRDKKVLVLRESDSTLVDDYFLKKKGEFDEREESLFVASLITILVKNDEEEDGSD